MHEISYEVPTTVAQAVTMLKRHGEKARPLCGGTDLLIQLRAGVPGHSEEFRALRRPNIIVDLKQIKELRQIKFDAKKGLRLGAAVSCIEVHESEVMRKHYPGLTEAAHLIGSLQIQNRASVGGNLCNGSPAADTTSGADRGRREGANRGRQRTREVAVERFRDLAGTHGAQARGDPGRVCDSRAEASFVGLAICDSFRAMKWISRWSASALRSPSMAIR